MSTSTHTMAMPTATEMKIKIEIKPCADCGISLTTWWIDEDDEAKQVYCADCFLHTGASCGGCGHSACRLCTEEESDDEE